MSSLLECPQSSPSFPSLIDSAFAWVHVLTPLGTALIATQSCMDISSPSSHQIAPLSGLAVLHHGRLVVLDCETELAAHYTAHAPAPGQFRLRQSYQASAATAPVPQHLTPQSDTNDSRCGQAEDDACAPSTASREDGGFQGGLEASVLPGGRRKRKRKVARAPNEAQAAVRHLCSRLAWRRHVHLHLYSCDAVCNDCNILSVDRELCVKRCLLQQIIHKSAGRAASRSCGVSFLVPSNLFCMQAARRHAAFRPALIAAEAALQQWLAESCGSGTRRTVREALRPTQSGPGPQSLQPEIACQPTAVSSEDEAGAVKLRQAVADGIIQSEQAVRLSRRAMNEDQLNFAALGHMKAAVRPTLTWEATSVLTVSRPSQASGDSHMSGFGSAMRAAENGSPEPASASAGLNGEHDPRCGGCGGGGDGGGGGVRSKLYDVLVRNEGDVDAVALAHEVLRQALQRPAPAIMDVGRQSGRPRQSILLSDVPVAHRIL